MVCVGQIELSAQSTQYIQSVSSPHSHTSLPYACGGDMGVFVVSRKSLDWASWSQKGAPFQGEYNGLRNCES